MGRWAGVTLMGASSTLLSIIQVYQTCDTSRAGAKTAHTQQSSIIAATSTGNVHDKPRQCFQKDLKTTLKHLLQAHHELIVMGDFNDDVGPHSHSPMATLLNELGLVNLHSHHHPDSTLPRTYNCSLRTLDAIYGTSKVANNIEAAGMEPFQDHLPSDH